MKLADYGEVRDGVWTCGWCEKRIPLTSFELLGGNSVAFHIECDRRAIISEMVELLDQCPGALKGSLVHGRQILIAFCELREKLKRFNKFTQAGK